MGIIKPITQENDLSVALDLVNRVFAEFIATDSEQEKDGIKYVPMKCGLEKINGY